MARNLTVMYLVERHNIEGNDEIIRLCELSKLLYNRVNYLMRQSYFDNTPVLSLTELLNEVRPLDCFQEFGNTKIATQVILQVKNDWSNYFKARKAFMMYPTKFLKEPKIPGYKKKLAQVTYYNESVRRKPLNNNILTPTNDTFSIKTDKAKIFKQATITPKTFGFVVEVKYQIEKPRKNKKLNKDNVAVIDIGLNNLCAITSNQHQPILINGRIVKSFNQQYNKNVTAKSAEKRYWRIENYFHHVSKIIIENCVKYNIGKIIIGKNFGWKQNMNMGKVNNQKFQSVPFNNLIQKLQYKAELVGIEIVFTEESYTSKASFMNMDVIPVYEKGKVTDIEFSGVRNKGLYHNNDGTILNSDVNGSANIGRKVLPEVISNNQWYRSLSERPMKINPLKFRNKNEKNNNSCKKD